MEDLPPELLSLIFSNADIDTLSNAALVNTKSYSQAKNIMKPDITHFAKSSVIKSKTWHDKQGNKRIINYQRNGEKKEEWFNEKKKLNREDGPAFQKWYHGQLMEEKWYINGKLSNENGPALQKWYPNRQKECEEWHVNGKFHRVDGPAFQKWYE